MCQCFLLFKVSHIFSHIHQTYIVEVVIVSDDIEEQLVEGTRWVTKQQFMESAVSTAMKKVCRDLLICIYSGLYLNRERDIAQR